MADYARMRLDAKGNPERLDHILQQECRQRFATKFPETLKCEGFRFPSLLAGEQASSDGMAQFHATLVGDAAEVFDMTLGLGIDAFAIARRGCRVTACDMDAAKVSTALNNARALGLKVDVRCADSLELLSHDAKIYDAIIVDPARRGEGGRRLFALADCSPDITGDNLSLIRKHAHRLIVKASPMLDISRAKTELADPQADVYVTGTKRECKELVIVSPGKGRLAVYVPGLYWEPVGDCPPAPYCEAVEEGCVLAEPWAVVMKSGAFNAFCRDFGAAMISPDTHLAVLKTPDVSDIPADVYDVRAVRPFDKRGVKEISALTQGRAEVAVRNFGMKADDLRQRLRIADGGADPKDPRRVYGIRDHGGRRLLLLVLPALKN